MITVDNREIEAQAGTPLLQALLDNGIFVPHFCYHPDLPVDGNCRQCLVQIDTPKGSTGVISCATMVQDGMVVRTNTEAIEKARRGVLEFLLVNHPVDCPVCDQAGECRLQQYYMDYGFHESRVEIEKVNKNKTLAIGPRVMLDQERCVLCRRCIRFTDHVTKSHELAVGGRGDHSHITTFPGLELDNGYSVNTVDVCPVGALTDRDFRFKCRAWFLKQTDVICHGCSRGCSAVLDSYNHTVMDEQNGTAHRMRPRRNPDVNKSWMCDEGRLLYKSVNEGRLRSPVLIGDEGQEAADWEEALAIAAQELSQAGPEGVAGLCSPDCTNEEIYLLRRFIGQAVGSEWVSAESLRKDGDQDDLLLRADKHPNTRGTGLQGPWHSLEELLARIDTGDLKVLVVLRNDFVGLAENAEELEQKLSELETLIVIDSNESRTSQNADIVLPCGSFAEREGTYINFQGRIQRTFRACLPRWDAKSEIEIFRALAERIDSPMEGVSSAQQIWQELSQAVEALNGASYTDIGRMGMMMKDNVMRDA